MNADKSLENFISSHLTPEIREKIFHLAADWRVDVTEIEKMNIAIQHGQNYFQFWKTNPDDIENKAVSLYQRRRFQEAENTFRLLSILSHSERYSAFRGLGACRQVANDIMTAIKNYNRALELNHNDFVSMVYLGQCFLFYQEKESAKGLLNFVIRAETVHNRSDQSHVELAKVLLPFCEPEAQAPSVWTTTVELPSKN